MKDELRGWLGSCAILCALHVISLLLRSERLAVGRLLIYMQKGSTFAEI